MSAEWSSRDMARIAEAVGEWTGLVFPSSRVRDVEATVTRAMDRRGVHAVSDFLRVLRDDAATRDQLVAELTIGESYFRRDPLQFALLQERILPELLASRPAERPIRVWSAGCAAGEEPYSIAMLFDELGALERAQIIGTDIARPRLADAQRAVYSRWSLRGTPDAERRRYFRERGRYFQLVPEIRERVDFRYLNLAEDRFPSLSIGIWGMDLILCRNVLIYFDAPTVVRVARRLIASLSETGWLVLGASDPAIAETVECDVVLTDAGLVYRRPGAAGDEDVRRGGALRGAVRHAAPPLTAADAADAADAAAAAAADSVHAADQAAAAEPAIEFVGAPEVASEEEPYEEPAPSVLPEVAPDAGTREAAAEAELLAAYARRDFDAVVAAAERAQPATLSAASWVSWVRALANQGCLEEAGRVAARAVRACGPSAELLYLNAVLLLQLGRVADAAVTARRALYLDRTLIVAHMTLADAQRRLGRTDDARRALRNAAVLLDELPPAAHVPASDGELAGRLVELVRVKLRLLEEAA